MAKAWSISTTVRNPDRLRDFIRVALNLDWQPRTKDNQCKFQILLIQSRLYWFWNTQFYNWLPQEYISLIEDINREITYEEAKKIFLIKNYKDPDMRWRQSLNPLKKLGFAYTDSNNIFRITDLWKAYMNPAEDLGNILFKSFLKLQYPNPDNVRDFTENNWFNIKPFIWTLQLIKKVNQKWEELWNEWVGLSKYEFSIFVHTLINYSDIDNYADKIISLRNELSWKRREEQKQIKDRYVRDYVVKFFWLNNDRDIEKQVNNLFEYWDNTLRYFRMTRFIYLRGNWHYIDLEPRRNVEIRNLLEMFDWSAESFWNREQYIQYLSNINEPPLPWENINELHEIIEDLLDEIDNISISLRWDSVLNSFSTENYETYTVEQLNKYINKLRLFRTSLWERIEYKSAQSLENLDFSISTLEWIYTLDDRALKLEKYTTYSLQSLNDSLGIKPNYPVWDDWEPTNTAPWWVADIECFYQEYNAICEVTLLKDRSQWFNEWQPVMRHLRDFENQHNDKPSYCLFIAPQLHQDTINTFWTSIKYEYEWTPQKIIPITINQFIVILNVLREFKIKDLKFRHWYIKNLFDDILNLENINNSIDWINSIESKLNNWKSSILH